MALLGYMGGSEHGFGGQSGHVIRRKTAPTSTKQRQAAAPSCRAEQLPCLDSMALQDNLSTPSQADHFAYKSLHVPFEPLPVPAQQLAGAARAHYAVPPLYTRRPGPGRGTRQGDLHPQHFSGHPQHFSHRSKQLLAQTAALRAGALGLQQRRARLGAFKAQVCGAR